MTHGDSHSSKDLLDSPRDWSTVALIIFPLVFLGALAVVFGLTGGANALKGFGLLDLRVLLLLIGYGGIIVAIILLVRAVIELLNGRVVSAILLVVAAILVVVCVVLAWALIGELAWYRFDPRGYWS